MNGSTIAKIAGIAKIAKIEFQTTGAILPALHYDK